MCVLVLFIVNRVCVSQRTLEWMRCFGVRIPRMYCKCWDNSGRILRYVCIVSFESLMNEVNVLECVCLVLISKIFRIVEEPFNLHLNG